MSLDYAELGFRCGIEIHQQLDTRTKLFCACANEIRNEEPVAQVKRFLRPVQSEVGEIDRAAQFEYLKGREFIYNIYRGNSCLVELDEEPPHEINEEAMETGLIIAHMLDCEIPDEIHVMRKTVIDGSNTGGFQRTAIIGIDGAVETEKGEVSIENLALEEESCGIHARDVQSATYDLNRLGIPLVEIGTAPDITSPEHAKETALKLGMLLRSTQNVKRGIGTIRQDVNVSIEEGARVEIKGLQDIKNVDRVIRKEVERQHALVEIREELQEDGGTIDGIIEDVTEHVAESASDLIRRVVEDGGSVKALVLPHLNGFFARELCKGKTLGNEMADYARAAGVKGIMHTDEDLSAYDIAEAEIESVREVLDAGENALIVLVAAGKEKARNALDRVQERAALLPEKVPEETRTTAEDFTTRYTRPLPGEARMYPETDIPPIPFTPAEKERLKGRVPETLAEKQETLAEEIGEELAAQIVRSRHLETFETLAETYPDWKKTIAIFFTQTLPDRKTREDVPVENLRPEHIRQLFAALDKETVQKDHLGDIAAVLAEHPEKDVGAVIADVVGEQLSEEELRSIVQDVIEAHAEEVDEQGKHAQGMLMGEIMKRVEGKASGSQVSSILEEELERVLD